MSNFSTGLSALRASRDAIEVVSNNIANANTPGFTRRRVNFAAEAPQNIQGQQIGAGVSIATVERVRSQITEAQLTFAISDASNAEQLLAIERQVEGLFQPGEGALTERIDSFFSELTQLTSTPDSPTQRNAVLTQATRIADSFQQISSQLTTLRNQVRLQIDDQTQQLNGRLEELADLTLEIRTLSNSTTPNQELDRRDALINEIAEIIDVDRNENTLDGQTLLFGGTSIQQGVNALQFNTVDLDGGNIAIELAQFNQTVTLNGGRLPALVEAYNEVIPGITERLDELASQFIQRLDQTQATGVGTAGPFSFLEGNRAVDDSTVPLAQAGTTFPINAGELFFSLTDAAGNRSTRSITIDPETQSLVDIANAISGIDNLRGSVNPQTNRLTITAAPGTRFDFTGNNETVPDLSGVSGSSIPTISGDYTGDTNQSLTYQIAGSGDVGISENLFADVFNQQGTFLTRVSIGQGYEAGSALPVFEGTSIAFSGGTVADGEQFSTTLVDNPDTTGALTALGLNTFFTGTDAFTIEVNQELQQNAGRLATGRTGDASDNRNLFELIELQDERSLQGGLFSFGEFLNDIQTEIGASVQSRNQLSVSLQSLQVRFEEERASLSGVDLNEELVQLQQFQRSFEAASQLIQAVDRLFDELFTIIR